MQHTKVRVIQKLTVLDLRPVHSDKCPPWNNKDSEPVRDEGQRKHEKGFRASRGDAVLKAPQAGRMI